MGGPMRTKNLIFLMACIFLLAVGAILLRHRLVRPGENIPTLEQGMTTEREISGAQVHSYRVILAEGGFLRAVIEQSDLYVTARVFSPGGRELVEIENLGGIEGYEYISLEAKEPGPFRIDIRAFEQTAAPSRYRLRVLELLTAEQYLSRLAAQREKIESVENWLRSTAIPLRSVEAGHGFEDMQPLKRVIGSARLVALGEATHGTREFFQLKHRMLEFLVSEMGFTVFGLEATMPEAFDVNTYVLTGKGDPLKALAGLYSWFWDTEEMLEMIQWMRRYNADPLHTKKVKFYGFDMLYAPRAMKVMLEYLNKVDPAQAKIFAKTLGVLADPFTSAPSTHFSSGIKSTSTGRQSEEWKEAAAALVRTILGLLDEHVPGDSHQGSSVERSIVRQHARILGQIIEGARMIDAENFNGYESFRDSSMAENVRWTLDREGPDAKMVIWAHNGHVADETVFGVESMGHHLRRTFGRNMVVFGFAFNQGSFQALGLPWPSEKGATAFSVGPAPAGTLDATLAATGLKVAAIDLHALPEEGPVADWFNEGQLARSIGLPYSEEIADKRFLKQKVAQIYDALFFVEHTAAARLNPGGRRPGEQRLKTPANLDFENSRPGEAPADWMVPNYLQDFDFAVATSEVNPRTGRRCAVISRTPGRHYGEMYGSFSQRIDAAAYRGSRIRLRAAARADVTGPGNRAYLWLRVMKKGQNVAFYDNMADRPITAREWREVEIVGDVPVEAETIDYGYALVGDGRAWLDSVSLAAIR